MHVSSTTPSYVTLLLLVDKRVRDTSPAFYIQIPVQLMGLQGLLSVQAIGQGLDNQATGAVVMHGATLLRMSQ